MVMIEQHGAPGTRILPGDDSSGLQVKGNSNSSSRICERVGIQQTLTARH